MTTLPLLATPEELAAFMQADLPADKVSNIEFILELVSDDVRAEAGRTWVDPSDPTKLLGVPSGIKGVVVRVAARAWSNPTAATQRTVGPFSDSLGSPSLTDSDRAAIKAALGKTGLSTISTTRGCLETPPVLDNWCSYDQDCWL